MENVDLVLRSFLQSTDEAERERLIDELILVHAVPIIRLVLRRQLGFYISQSGANVNNPDAADLFNDVVTKIVERLREFQSRGIGEEIRDFSGYVNRTTTNVCHDYLRKKYSARYLLKNRIRYLFAEHPDFTIWKAAKRISLCGFADWAERKIATAEINDEDLEDISEQIRVKRLAIENLHEAPLAEIVAEIFKLAGKPIELRHLVNIVAKILDTQDPHPNLWMMPIQS